ncbi:ubiquitin-associated protein 1-like isoform X1 [Glandiceps talaboti]
MAYRRDLERSVSVPYINYLDGVEFKIGEKFKMPTRVSLPVNYHQKDPTELLSREYDFTVENEVLRWAEERNRAEAAREAEEQARREAQAHVLSLGGVDSTTRNDLDILASANGTQVLEPRIAPVVANMSNEVMQPVLSNPTRRQQSNPDGVSPNSINIADFEAVASDPFEATELKTINDLEELSRVLESSYPNTTEAQPRVNGGTVNVNTRVTNRPTMVTDSVDSSVSIQASTGQVSFSRERSADVQANHNPYSVPNGPMASSPPSQTTIHANGSANVPRPFSRHAPLPPIPSSRPSSDQSDNNCMNNSSRSTSMPDITGGQVNFSSEPNYASYPDSFHTANDFAAIPARAATPPPPYQEMETDSSLNRYTPLPRPPSQAQGYPIPTEAPPAYSTLPNPYSMMSSKERQFTDRITAMGFPQHRVARAVQRLGEDDKQVVDTLCAIERLVEGGYPEESVEMALNVQDNEEQAIEFLKLLKQFEELGFKQDDITRQLILHGTHQDKVLDGLTASS